MKNIICCILSVVSVFIFVSYANAKDSVRQIGVIIIADPDFKTNSDYEIIEQTLNYENNSTYKIIAGDKAQSKFMDYWARKGFMEEQKTTDADMIAFTKASGYDKVLFVIQGDINMREEKLSTGKMVGNVLRDQVLGSILGGSGKTKSTKTIATLGIDAVLCGNSRIIKEYKTTKESGSDDSYDADSDVQESAFRACMKDIGEKFITKF